MSTYRVMLHGHASAAVTVEADSVVEANREAIKKAPRNKHVKSWTPVMTSKLEGPDVPRETEG